MFGKKTSTNMFEASKDSSVLGQSIAWLAICLGLLVAGARWLGLPEATLTWLDRLVLYIGFLLLIVGFLWNELRTVRGRRYAKIQRHFHSISHIIRDQHAVLDAIESGHTSFEKNEYLLRSHVGIVLNHFAFSFSMLTGTNCRACIKLFVEESESESRSSELYVSTFVRDQFSFEAQSKTDIKRDTSADPLNENTDFKAVLKDDTKRWFFSNYLPALSNYENTSDPTLAQRQLSFIEALTNRFVPVGWKLPYVSTIVWPIQKPFINDVDGAEYAILGFLTVDSPSRGVFNRNHDVYYGAGIADMLFPLLRRMQILGETNDEQRS